MKTGSRTGFLLMVIALLSCALLSSKRMILIGALLLVVVFGWAFVPKQYQERYAGMLALDEGPKQEEDAAYASAYDDLVERSRAVYWIHGHTHHAANYVVGGTRVISNPRGYPDEPVQGFDPELVLRLGEW